MFTKWRLIGRAQCQISNKANHGLDQRPLAWRMQQFDNDRKSIALTDVILRSFSVIVSTGQMTKGTNLAIQQTLIISSKCGKNVDFNSVHINNVMSTKANF